MRDESSKRTGLKLGIGVLILLFAMPSHAFLCLLAHAAAKRHHPRPLIRPAFRQGLPAIMPMPPWRAHQPGTRRPADAKARPVVYRGWVFRNPAN